MKKTSIFSIIGLVVLFLISSCNSSQRLFLENSKTWEAHGEAIWNFSNNELIGKITDGAGFVMTMQTYQDFTLELECKPDSTINSSVFIRCKNKDISAIDCYELNIWDLHPDQDNRTGAIVTKTKPLAFVETINKWNTYKIKVEKNHIQVWINNTSTADTKDKGLSNGYIGLQAKGTGVIKFRNIKIKTK